MKFTAFCQFLLAFDLDIVYLLCWCEMFVCVICRFNFCTDIDKEVNLRYLGKHLDQKSACFHQEFPELAVGAEEKSQQSKKGEENKELQYGPGPSLRPQSRYLV